MGTIYSAGVRESTTLQAVTKIRETLFRQLTQFPRTLERRITFPRWGSSIAARNPSKNGIWSKGAGADCEVRMRTRRNDYTVAVVWIAVIGLVVVAQWFKVPLG